MADAISGHFPIDASVKEGVEEPHDAPLVLGMNRANRVDANQLVRLVTENLDACGRDILPNECAIELKHHVAAVIGE